MSAQIQKPYQSAMDRNGKKLTAVSKEKDAGVCDDSGNMHNPMYGFMNNLPSQEDGMYPSRLNAQPSVKLNSSAVKGVKLARGNLMGCGMKRFLCVLFSIFVVVFAIAALTCLLFALVKISKLNYEITSLQLRLSTVMAAEKTSNVSESIENIEKGLRSFGLVFNPAASCAAVLALVPSSPSGYYWIRSNNGSAVHVYCDMTRSCGGVTGGWMRVAELDMTNSSSQCPRNLTEHTDSNIRTCGIGSSGASCSSVTLPTGVTYSKVCGRIQAYQNGSTDAFSVSVQEGRNSNQDINTPYVDGVSLTHGSLRKHIWTFAAAHGGFAPSNCPCNVSQASNATHPPAFVGEDYFCDTGNYGSSSASGIFFSENPLWDGAGCFLDNMCCSFNNPPWFYKQLPAPTTDDIEMRVCSDQERGNEDIAVKLYDIFVKYEL